MLCPCELSLTSQMFRSVVWPWIFPILWVLVALGQSHAGSPCHHPGLHADSTMFHRQVPPSKVEDRSLLCLPWVGSVLHTCCLADHPHSQQDSTLALMCSGHHSWNTRPTALAHWGCHQLRSVHFGGAGPRHTTQTQPHAGKLTNASTSSSPCSQPLLRPYKRQTD